MLTLYTTVGHLALRKGQNQKNYPEVHIHGQEYALVPEELVLWSSLAFQILTLDELKEAYQEGIALQGITSSGTFEYFLRRLLIRELIVKGSGLTGVDALYRLLGGLYIKPTQNSVFLRLFTCIRLYTKGDLSLSQFQQRLKKPENTKLEKLVLELSHTLPLSVAELLSYVELNSSLPPQKALQELYETTEETCDTLAEKVQLHKTQLPIMQAIGNLYLQKQILFSK